MSAISVTKARDNIYQLISDVNANCQPITITNYSRRINIQHRLVYQVYAGPIIFDGVEYQGTVKIIRMWTRYDGLR